MTAVTAGARSPVKRRRIRWCARLPSRFDSRSSASPRFTSAPRAATNPGSSKTSKTAEGTLWSCCSKVKSTARTLRLTPTMKITDILQHGRSVSFEFFPPRDDEAEATLEQTLRELEPLHPSYVSVTYG